MAAAKVWGDEGGDEGGEGMYSCSSWMRSLSIGNCLNARGWGPARRLAWLPARARGILAHNRLRLPGLKLNLEGTIQVNPNPSLHSFLGANFGVVLDNQAPHQTHSIVAMPLPRPFGQFGQLAPPIKPFGQRISLSELFGHQFFPSKFNIPQDTRLL